MNNLANRILKSGAPYSAIYLEKFVLPVVKIHGDPGDKLGDWLVSGLIIYELVNVAAPILGVRAYKLVMLSGHSPGCLSKWPNTDTVSTRIIWDLGKTIEILSLKMVG